KLLYPRKRRYTGQPLRGYRSPKTARDPRYRPLKTLKIRGNERLSGQPLFDLGPQTAKGFAEPVETFAVEGGEIREVDGQGGQCLGHDSGEPLRGRARRRITDQHATRRLRHPGAARDLRRRLSRPFFRGGNNGKHGSRDALGAAQIAGSDQT